MSTRRNWSLSFQLLKRMWKGRSQLIMLPRLKKPNNLVRQILPTKNVVLQKMSAKNADFAYFAWFLLCIKTNWVESINPDLVIETALPLRYKRERDREKEEKRKNARKTITWKIHSSNKRRQRSNRWHQKPKNLPFPFGTQLPIPKPKNWWTFSFSFSFFQDLFMKDRGLNLKFHA